MQSFSEKFIGIILLVCLFAANLRGQVETVDAESMLSSADRAFDEGKYTDAMAQYESVFANGSFSESMLYRMAFMHENLRNYPEAIYYLKKAAQEFGDRGTDAKIRQLMQRQGSTRFFTGDNWNDYLEFFRTWSWAFYLAFGLSLAALAAHYYWRDLKRPVWRQLAAVVAWTVFLSAGAMLFHRSFMVPQRGVLLSPTAFYEEPGFSAEYKQAAFSLGETLDIEGRQDVWLKVSAGGRVWWVPKWTVREL